MDDRYQINKRTAELPYGVQFEATDTLINRQAQIHRFTKPGDDAPSDWEKLYDQASIDLSTLSHMGLPIIYDRGVNDAGPYLIRQLVDEPTLSARLEEGPLSEYEAWELAQQLLDIHTAGVAKEFFHGALSPDQICYATRPGGEKRYYISNFGLPEMHNKINGTSEYYGLPCLVSLEQTAGEAPTEASEIFSIGQLLYLCLSDNHPFASNRVDEMAELHKNYPLAPINLAREDVPKGMSDWLYRLTSPDPKERFDTFADALHNLPGPVQTAPIPVIPTTTTTQQTLLTPNGQTTSVQQTVSALTGTQAVGGFTTTTQAITATAGMGENKQGGALKQILKEPMILGGIAAIVVLIIVSFVMLGGDDDDEAAKSQKTTITQDDSSDSDDRDQARDNAPAQKGVEKGLVVALNFDGSLNAENESSVKAEKLKSFPKYEKGLYGKGLVLDKEHFYRLAIEDSLPDSSSSSFTISFWIKNLDQQKPAFISDQPWSGVASKKVSRSSGGDFWQWSPDNSLADEGDGNSSKHWDMITMVFSRKSSKVTIYNNGEMMGSSETDAIESLGDQKYLFIGCDSRQKFNFASPTVIDQLYIWDRKLSSKEIRGLYKDEFSL